MTDEQLEEGFYWVRELDDIDDPEWEAAFVDPSYRDPMVFLTGIEGPRRASAFEIGPRLTPPQE